MKQAFAHAGPGIKHPLAQTPNPRPQRQAPFAQTEYPPIPVVHSSQLEPHPKIQARQQHMQKFQIRLPLTPQLPLQALWS